MVTLDLKENVILTKLYCLLLWGTSIVLKFTLGRSRSSISSNPNSPGPLPDTSKNLHVIFLFLCLIPNDLSYAHNMTHLSMNVLSCSLRKSMGSMLTLLPVSTLYVI